MSAEWLTLLDGFHRTWSDPLLSRRVALADDTGEYTYSQLYELVARQAGSLRELGVEPGDRVALAMERSAALAVAILAVVVAGGCPCPMEPKLGDEEAQRRAAVAGFHWVLADDANGKDPSLASLASKGVLAADVSMEAEPFWMTGLDPMSDGFLLFTSGSSGKPKGVLQNHRGLLANSLGVIAHTSLTNADRLLHVMPLHHTNGVNNQLFAPLLAGASVYIAGRFRAESMPELLERWRPTVVTGVPTMYARMLPLEFSRDSLKTLRVLRCGSAPITEELHRRIEERFGIPLIVSYGLSEATCTSTMNHQFRRSQLRRELI